MAYRRKSRGTRGLKCIRKKRVRVRGVRGRKTAMRCAKYGSKRRSGYGRKRRTTSRRRRSAGMAKRGSHCTRYKRVRLRRKVGGRRYVRRCAHYSSRRRRRAA
jgi:hypothetical protein